MKAKRFLTAVIAGTVFAAAFAGCGSSSSSDSAESQAQAPATAAAEEKKEDKKELTVIKGLADLTPHSEILKYVEPAINEKGYTVDIVSTASDATWNEKVVNGEVDFNFTQHEPYLIEWNEINSGRKDGPRILACDYAVSVPGGHMTGSVALPANSPFSRVISFFVLTLIMSCPSL